LIIQVLNLDLKKEFIAATMGRSQYMKDSKLRSVFHMLDTDGSGKIDKNELKNILAKHKA